MFISLYFVQLCGTVSWLREAGTKPACCVLRVYLCLPSKYLLRPIERTTACFYGVWCKTSSCGLRGISSSLPSPPTSPHILQSAFVRFVLCEVGGGWSKRRKSNIPQALSVDSFPCNALPSFRRLGLRSTIMILAAPRHDCVHAKPACHGFAGHPGLPNVSHATPSTRGKV